MGHGGPREATGDASPAASAQPRAARTAPEGNCQPSRGPWLKDSWFFCASAVPFFRRFICVVLSYLFSRCFRVFGYRFSCVLLALCIVFGRVGYHHCRFVGVSFALFRRASFVVLLPLSVSLRRIGDRFRGAPRPRRNERNVEHMFPPTADALGGSRWFCTPVHWGRPGRTGTASCPPWPPVAPH